MSLFRNSKGSDTASTVLTRYAVWYTTGQYTAFDLFLRNYHPGIDYNYTYFGTVYAGLEEVAAPIIRRITNNHTFVDEGIFKITAPFRPIGNRVSHNAMYTMLINFYKDYNYFGVFFYSYLWGAINAFVYNRFFKKPSLSSLSILLLITYTLIMSAIRWEPMLDWFWFALFVVFLVTTVPKFFRKLDNASS